MKLNYFLQNIYNEFTEFHKKIVQNKYFEQFIKSKEIKDLNELNIFFENLKDIFIKCPNNEYSRNLLPIDPNTGEEIDVENILVENNICVNKLFSTSKKSSIFKKLVGLFLVSLMASTTYINFPFYSNIPSICDNQNPGLNILSNGINSTYDNATSVFNISSDAISSTYVNQIPVLNISTNSTYANGNAGLNISSRNISSTDSEINHPISEELNEKSNSFVNNYLMKKKLEKYGINLIFLDYKIINDLDGVIKIKVLNSYYDEILLKNALKNSLIKINIKEENNDVVLTIDTNKTQNDLLLEKKLLKYNINLNRLKYVFINEVYGVITIKLLDSDENLVKSALKDSLLKVNIKKENNNIFLTINTNNKYDFIGLSNEDSVKTINDKIKELVFSYHSDKQDGYNKEMIKLNDIRNMMKNQKRLERFGINLHKLNYYIENIDNTYRISIPFNTKLDKNFILSELNINDKKISFLEVENNIIIYVPMNYVSLY